MESNKNNVEFTELENKIRKRWLFWSLLLPAFMLGSVIIGIIIYSFAVKRFEAMAAVLVLLLLSVGGFYLKYHCAYKNPGTILLLLEMIGIPINLLPIFFKPHNLALMRASLVFSLFMLAVLFEAVIVFYYSYQLRKINKDVKERKLIATPTYINVVSVFSTATTLEELNDQFSKLSPSHDGGIMRQILSKAYNQHKKNLMIAKSNGNN